MAQAQPLTQAPFVIDAATRLGHVHYTAADLDQQAAFYQDVLGFKLHWRESDSAGLGAGKEDLLRLTEVKGARRAHRTTGLYHTAFLVPNAWELAKLLKRIAETRTPIQGMTDHGTHHAIYLPDSEDNGIELAMDFPRDRWPKTATEMMSRNRGLHPDTVFAALEDNDAPWQGLDAATKVGHVHLHVSQLAETVAFYQEILGFEQPFDFSELAKVSSMGDTARFFAAGGYHHHIGTNIWQGAGAPPPPADAIGLRYFTVVVPDEAALAAVTARLEAAGIDAQETDDGLLIHDPARNGVLLTSEKK